MDSQYYLVPAVDSVSARLPEHTSPAAPPSLQAMAIIKHWHRDQEIIEQDGESQHWYCVISGSARQSLVAPRWPAANRRHPAPRGFLRVRD